MTRRLSILLLAAVVVAVVNAASHGRTSTDRQGRQFEGDYVAFTEDVVRIKRTSDGRAFDVPLERLSDGDQAFAKSQARSKGQIAQEQATSTDPVLRELSGANGMLRFDGIYWTRLQDGRELFYLRFYPDGTFIDVCSTGTPREVARWFDRSKRDLTKGTYRLRGSALYATMKHDSDRTTEMEGKAMNDRLVLAPSDDEDGSWLVGTDYEFFDFANMPAKKENPSFGTNDVKPGDEAVVAKNNARLTVGADVLAELDRGTKVRVTAVNGNWVGVAVTIDGKQRTGWLKNTSFLPESATEPKRERQEVAKKPMTPATMAAAKKKILGSWKCDTDCMIPYYMDRYEMGYQQAVLPVARFIFIKVKLTEKTMFIQTSLHESRKGDYEIVEVNGSVVKVRITRSVDDIAVGDRWTFVIQGDGSLSLGLDDDIVLMKRDD